MFNELSLKANTRTLVLRGLIVLVLLFSLAAGSVLAQDDSGGSDTAGQSSLYGFRIESTLGTLSTRGSGNADATESTIYAFLSSQDGNGISGETVRFVVQEGTAELFEGAPRGTGETSVNGEDVGNGVYVATLRSGDVAGNVTVAAQWLTAPESPVPVASTDIRIITAEQLSVVVDDDAVLADGQDSATIVAYVLDGLNKPVANQDVRFRLVNGGGQVVRGPGEMSKDQLGPGRYVARYISPSTPGTATIEVSLPTITNPIRTTIEIQAVEASTLEAFAFPTRVGRRLADPATGQLPPPTEENISTIIVAVRDGDGELVTGLTANDLQADVISGPGNVAPSRPFEIDYTDPRGGGSGVYQFRFDSSGITGDSVIRITNTSAPSIPSTEVTVTTTTEIGRSVIDRVEMLSFSEEPFYTDGVARALVLAVAADEDGNIPTDKPLEPDFLIINGQGSVAPDRMAQQLDTRGNLDTGIFVTTYTPDNRNLDSLTSVRSIFSSVDADVVTATTEISLTALAAPDVIIFPNPIPAGRDFHAFVDIFDVNDQFVAFNGVSRYMLSIESGPGSVTDANSVGGPPDPIPNVDAMGQLLDSNNAVVMDAAGNPILITDGNPNVENFLDNMSSGQYSISRDEGSNQDVTFSISDDAVAGNPTTQAVLSIGQDAVVRAVVSPDPADAGEDIQVIAFVEDEFGLPALNHDLRITIVSGSANVLAPSVTVGRLPGNLDPNDTSVNDRVNELEVAGKMFDLGQLTVQGVRTTDPKLDANGNQEVDNNGNPVFLTTNVTLEDIEVGSQPFKDVIGNDGAYVGAIAATGVARGTVVIRITDLTPPNQPSVEVVVPIARS